MKKFLLAIALVITPLVFFGCGDSDPAEVDVGEEVSFEKLTGVVRKLGASIYPEGTHRLEADGSLVALLEAASSAIDLDDFVGESVEIEGILSPTTDGNLQILKVVAITSFTENGIEIADEPTKNVIYRDAQFGFSVKYSTALESEQTSRGVAFFDDDDKIIELIVLENSAEQSLLDWLVDNYGYTVDALSRISVAGMTGFQFQNTTGSVIYLDDGAQVFTLAWYDNSENNRAKNRLHYLEIIQNFTLGSSSKNLSDTAEPTVALDGDFCGGIAAIECASGFECRLSGDYPDSGGICVTAKTATVIRPGAATSDQVPTNESLDEISAAELQRGWYYGDREQKKPGTPDIWILASSGTRSAMWRRPDSAPAEPEFELSEANSTSSELSAEQNTVLNYLQKNIDSLAPDPAEKGEWLLVQIAFAEPNFVYSTFESTNSAGEKQTRRLLSVFAISGDEVALELQAYFQPGEEKDWLVIEGADTAFGAAQKIVNPNGELVSNIAEGYRLFNDYSNKISFQYPKNWYWRKPVAGKIEFADKPFPAGVVILTAKIFAGSQFDFGVAQKEGDETVIYFRFDSEKSVRLSITDLKYLDVLEVAGDSFVVLD